MSPNKVTRAVCLTPPGMGGVAVVQVIGPDAPAVVGPCLRSRRPLHLDRLPEDHLRLCQLVEEDEILDDVLVCVRRGSDAEEVIDLNIHGGPRIVERLLMLLQKRGVRIVSRMEEASLPPLTGGAIEREALQLLPYVQTRPVVEWLLRVKETLPVALEECAKLLENGQIEEVRRRLIGMTSFQRQVKWLIHGARIVIMGRPNAGKSTLVNALAEREQILVSDIPGTTRDYVEQPAAIEGVPILMVDTAGIRDTQDPLEAEAIQRAQAQTATADLILELIDACAAPLDLDDDAAGGFVPAPTTPERCPPVIRAWNKIDLPLHPLVIERMRASQTPLLQLSAATGAGLPALRHGLLEALGLAGWQDRTAVTFSSRQHELLTRTLNELKPGSGSTSQALSLLERCRFEYVYPADASPSVRL